MEKRLRQPKLLSSLLALRVNMLRLFVFYFGLSFAFALSNLPAFANEPLIQIKAKNSRRLVTIAESLGLPDPFAAAGMGSADNIDTFKDVLHLEAPVGGIVFITDKLPRLVIALPVERIEDIVAIVPGLKPDDLKKDKDGIAQFGEQSKVLAIKTAGYVLIGDDRICLRDAAAFLTANPLTSVRDDVSVNVSLNKLHAVQRALLLKETLSMLNAKPTTEIAFDSESLKEYLRFGLQRYLVQSIFESQSFEIAANERATGELTIQLRTIEDASNFQLPSQFAYVGSTTPTVSLDFASRLSPETVNQVIAWAKNTEKDLLNAIGGDAVTNKGDLAATASIVHCITEMVTQSVSQHSADNFFTLGNIEGKSYLFAGFIVQDGSYLTAQLEKGLSGCKELGVVFQDLRTADEQAQKNQVNVVFDLPSDTKLLGMTLEPNSKLHLQLINNRLSLAIGEEAERIHVASQSNHSVKNIAPVTFYCDLSAGNELASGVGKLSLLPQGFRKLKWTIQVSELGRDYDFVLEKSPATELANNGEADSNTGKKSRMVETKNTEKDAIK